MSERKFLLVGASGFLGTRVCAALERESLSYDIIARELSPSLPKQKCILSHEIAELPQDEYTHVLLVAAHVPHSASELDLAKLRESNIDLPRKVSSQFGSVAHITHTSSTAVFARSNMTINEESLTIPETDYGSSKLEGEKAILASPRNCVLRYTSIFGVGMKRHTFLPRIIESALLRKTIVLFGDGRRLQNYIGVEDAAQLMLCAARQEVSGVLLGTASRSYSNFEVASIVREVLGSGVDITFQGEDVSPSFLYDDSKRCRLIPEFQISSFRDQIINLARWIESEF